MIGAAGPVAAELVEPIRERISTLKDSDRDSEARAQLAFALGQIGPAALSAAPDLVAMLDDDRAGFSAAAALGSIGPAARSTGCGASSITPTSGPR
jgi:HEAT repeat protein